MTNENGKSFGEVVAELKDELKEFVATRLAMLQAEMREKAQAGKMAAPALLVGAVLLGTAWLVLTICIVLLIAMAFSPPWNFIIGLLIVFGAYILIGLLTVSMGLKTLRETGLKPERTIRTLKEDKIWLETEVKTQP